MPHGVFFVQVVAVRSDVVDDVGGQRFFIDLDATGNTSRITDGFITIINGVKMSNGHPAFRISNVVTKVSASQGRKKTRQGAFEGGLFVKALGVRTAAGLPERQADVMGHLGGTGHHQTKFGGTVAQYHGIHVHNRKNTPHEKGQAGSIVWDRTSPRKDSAVV